jgi:hypothetical protein
MNTTMRVFNITITFVVMLAAMLGVMLAVATLARAQDLAFPRPGMPIIVTNDEWVPLTVGPVVIRLINGNVRIIGAIAKPANGSRGYELRVPGETVTVAAGWASTTIWAQSLRGNSVVVAMPSQ